MSKSEKSKNWVKFTNLFVRRSVLKKSVLLFDKRVNNQLYWQLTANLHNRGARHYHCLQLSRKLFQGRIYLDVLTTMYVQINKWSAVGLGVGVSEVENKMAYLGSDLQLASSE